MNIDSIKNYPTGSLVKHKRKNQNVLENRQKSADLCERKNVNRGYYGGSFTGIKNVAAVAGSLAPKKQGKISKLFDKMLELCDEKTVIAQNLVALFLAAGLRPLAIMSLPGDKDKDDKKYASGHSIASGIIGFGFSTIVMSPLDAAAKKLTAPISEASTVIQAQKDILAGKQVKDKVLKKMEKIKEKYKINDLSELENIEVFKKLKKTYNANTLVELDHSQAYKNVTRMLKMAPDVFIFGIAKAMLTIALIPPILKYGFGMEKKKKTQEPSQSANQIKTQTVENNKQQNTTPVSSQSIIKPEMSKFAGGLK